ncbi:MAG: glycerophosphoryl diester phosphodiesterase membrane domain-containing protein [Oscillospiraceae bacterium]|nr:glycerophosphoryl diester phosphodiesterase membrane domain-containing protein [Oscillospiraceae bacterium]
MKLKQFFRTMFTPYQKTAHNIGSILRFELTYRLLSMLVFFPALGGMQRVLLWVNRATNVAAYNAGHMLRNPLSWIVLLAEGIMLTIFAMFEQFALSEAIHASYCGHKITAREMLTDGAFLTVRYFKPRNFLIILYVLFILPLAALFDTSSVTKFIALPGFIVESIEKYWYWELLYYSVLVLVFYLAIRWFYSIIVMAVENVPDFRAAVRRSSVLTKGKYKLRLTGLSLFWASVVAVLGLLAFAVVSLGFSTILILLGLDETRWGEALLSDHGLDISMVVFLFIFSWLNTPILLTSYQGEYYRRTEQLGGYVPEYVPRKHIWGRRRLIKPLLYVIVAAVMVYTVPMRVRQVRWSLNTGLGLPMMMAHRGYSAAAPENTIEALLAAADIGVQSVEFDVQMTKDGEIILLHDDSLDRTTGYHAKIWDVTYDQIRELDASVGFRDETGLDYPATRIPTLDSALKAVKESGLFCNIEIKRTGHDAGIEAKTVEIIRANDFLDQCDVTSQDYSTLEAVRAADPEVLTAYTTVIGLGDIENLEAADIISIQESFATYQEVQRLHAAGKRVFVWTINDADVMEKLISLNVDAILTNDPSLGQEVLNDHDTDFNDIINRVQQILNGF